MAGTGVEDGAEDVTEFLKRIKELGDKRDREDAETTKRLENDILEGRRQREARKAERARSLSPEKQSPASSPQTFRSPRNPAKLDQLPASPLYISTSVAKPDSIEDDLGDAKMGLPPTLNESRALNQRTEQREAGRESPSAAMPLNRSNTLSWQQRPASSRGTRNRPMSMIDRPSPAPEISASAIQGSTEDTNMTKAQITQNLSSKDPAWFRQTADRPSPAFRKKQDDGRSAKLSALEKKQLPGMSRESLEIVEAREDEGFAAKFPSRQSSSGKDTTGATPVTKNGDNSTNTGSSFAEKLSPMPTLASQRFDPPSSEEMLSGAPRDVESSPKSRPVSPDRIERPASPTKGMGGFVQSAMLKRSDSVQKRWSAQPVTSLGKQDPTASRASNRSPTRTHLEASYSAPRLGDKLESTNFSSSSEFGGNLFNDVQARKPQQDTTAGLDLVDRAESPSGGANIFSKTDILPVHDRSRSFDVEAVEGQEISPPASPSKRWSPTKSTWLESALGKPESPKPKLSTPLQPSWMSDLQKAKKDRAERGATHTDEAKPVASRAFAPTDGNRSAPEHSKASGTKATPKTPHPKPKTISLSESYDQKTVEYQITPSEDPPQVKPQKPASPSPQRKPSFASSPVTNRNVSAEKKPKPATPPKKDLKSGLKPGHVPSSSTGSEQPEFLSAFGNLKRTKTEKYVAPDVLKGNILRGKAALSVTGGPQKTARRDELKESLLSQKEAMRAKAVEARSSSDVTENADKKAPVELPEAIARKKMLQKDGVRPPSSESVVKRQNRSIPQTHSSMSPSKTSETAASRDVVADGSSVLKTKSLPQTSKMANKFNPALASILARRPSPAAQGLKAAPENAIPLIKSSPRPTVAEENASSAPLEHMTKTRARGPKRRTPTSKPVSVESSGRATTKEDISVFNGSAANPVTSSRSENPPLPSPKLTGMTTTEKGTTQTANPPLIAAEVIEAKIPQNSSPTETTSGPRSPPLPSKPSSLRSFDTPKFNGQRAAELKKPESEAAVSVDQTASPGFVKNASSVWAKPKSLSSEVSPAKSPIKLPTRADEQAAMESAGLASTVKETYLKRDTDLVHSLPSPSSATPRGLSNWKSVSNETSLSPSKQAGVATPVSPLVTPAATPPGSQQPKQLMSKSEALSPNSQVLEVRQLLMKLFNETPMLPEKLGIDTNAIITANAEGPNKIKTERKSINELKGDGKLSPVNPNQEHILYDSTMYICTHVFTVGNGARTTLTYLWAGSAVPSSTIEDAQLFARKVAKDHGGKLIILRQGKEPEDFFEALGGILITRNGSVANSARSYVLCGRQHLGHVSFDEVDMSLSVFCSGFPYIVAAPSGKIYLWKGAGCSAEELGCARLISMDVGANGEVVEIDDGKEPAEFLSIFPAGPGKGIPRSADHWHQKPSYNNYKTRLFQIDSNAATSQKAIEIVPVCQADLDPANIYVVDAFFELYVITGASAQSKAAAFATALLFAQEYGILAASYENRPFLPIGTVVIEGTPKDLKTAFRSWDERAVPTRSFMTGKMNRVGGLKTLSLSAVIQATRAA